MHACMAVAFRSRINRNDTLAGSVLPVRKQGKLLAVSRPSSSDSMCKPCARAQAGRGQGNGRTGWLARTRRGSWRSKPAGTSLLLNALGVGDGARAAELWPSASTLVRGRAGADG